MKPIELFKAEDFYSLGYGTTNSQIIANHSNARLNEWLASQVVVEGYRLEQSNLVDEHGPGWVMAEPATRMQLYAKTHKAYLVGLEPTVQESPERRLLREWVAAVGPYMDKHKREVDGKFYEQAKALLEREP